MNQSVGSTAVLTGAVAAARVRDFGLDGTPALVDEGEGMPACAGGERRVRFDERRAEEGNERREGGEGLHDRNNRIEEEAKGIVSVK